MILVSGAFVDPLQEASLPQFQSLIIVLMKGVLQNVTAAITSANGQQHPGMPGSGNNTRINGGGPALNRSHDSGAGLNGSATSDSDSSLEDLDAARGREVESKAATGIILLLLKWLKVSRKYHE